MLYFVIFMQLGEGGVRNNGSDDCVLCFRYKWNYSGLSLDKRLDFFESNWPFFAGFGKTLVIKELC